MASKWLQRDLETDALQTEMFFFASLITADCHAEKQRATLQTFTVLNKEPECYANTIKLMEIALMQHLTSCSSERTFSKLKIIISRMRSTMNQERLENLMLMSIESDIMEDLDKEKLVQDFMKISLRRVNLV